VLKKTPFCCSYFISVLLLLIPGHVVALDKVDQARSLLGKMVAANRELNYSGVFTYEHAGVLKSIRILHIVKDDLEYEHLLYLNGPRKEVIRRGVPLDCKSVSDRFLGGLPMTGNFVSQLENHYELFLRGEERIADRVVRVLQVVPKDDMRYGFILSIDKESGLLLQSLLIGTNRRAMERFHYVDLNLNPDPEATQFLLEGERDSHSCDTPGNIASQDWTASWIPPGFEMVASEPTESGGSAMSFTDGLSFVSVFVDPEGQNNFPEIQAQRGATVAQVSKVSFQGADYTVCVVGEIPADVASRIARFVTPMPSP
jgi:sigma-E factor negative regulatory protein RseB